MSCWACEQPTSVFYRVDAVPAGSCVLLSTPEAALDYPTGELRLSHCSNCGLVQNDAFDESLLDYASGYEASQSFSPTFTAFAHRLADGLIERYGLEAARILEPGCGDGDFLALMVERTGGTGLGLDPAHVPGRLPCGMDDRIEVRRELFTPNSAVTGDLIVCRHTLEHIRDLPSFMEATQRAAARTPGSVVVFEVPESYRILAGGAFWDVYYEHSTYFTPASVIDLFRRFGLHPRHVWLAFDDQYIIIEAGSDPAGRLEVPAMAGDVADVVSTFASRVAERASVWAGMIEGARRPVVWGASSKAVGFMASVPGVTHAVDINPHKHGSYLAGSGVPVIGPDDLAAIEPDLVVVMNPIYAQEIRAMLQERRVEADLVALV